MNCFVINLESAAGRREEMSRQLRGLGISFEIFPAVDGRKMTEQELRTHYDAGKAAREREKMTGAEIGCALSHLGIYRKMVEQNIPQALVLEDDADLSPDLKPVLERLAEHYAAEQEIVVLLNHVPNYLKRSQVELMEGRTLARTHGLCWSSHGYFITLKAAQRMLERLHPVWIVADHWMRFQELGIVSIRALVPYCVGLREAAEISSIGVRGDKQGGFTGYLRRHRERYWHSGLLHYLYRKTRRTFSRLLATLSRDVVRQQKDR
ncbi:MAG: glycosyltransferase family 25 protein [Verrucomicrobiales bacterium]|jgi:glycosyl transferase family 25|nr:glycosyltransferase family 25 protein [Verrucomicrobiales bacterium]